MVNLLGGSIGKKLLMAVTGLILFLFLLGHLLGNLLIFNGSEAINAYAYWLQNNPLLWLIRLFMLVIVGLHIYLALCLAKENYSARKISYRVKRDLQLDWASKGMLGGGIFIALFLIFHIIHLTLGWINTDVFNQIDANGLPDIYFRLISAFQNIWISSLYILAIFVITLHLSHALKSFFHTMGFHHQNSQQMIRYLVPVLVVAFAMAFIAIPLCVMLGLLTHEGTNL